MRNDIRRAANSLLFDVLLEFECELAMLSTTPTTVFSNRSRSNSRIASGLKRVFAGSVGVGRSAGREVGVSFLNGSYCRASNLPQTEMVGRFRSVVHQKSKY